MNYGRLLELFWGFAEYIESLHTLYLDSIAGYSILHDRLLSHQQSIKKLLGNHEYATEQFQDTCSIIYKHLCDKDFTPVAMSPVMKQRDIKDRTKEDGKNYLLLGAQCVVAAYSYCRRTRGRWFKYNLTLNRERCSLGAYAETGET